MSDGQEYKLKRRETLIWQPSGASVEGWEYSNRYGTLSFVPQTATLGDFYTFTYQLLGHSLLYQRDITIYDESETGITETEQNKVTPMAMNVNSESFPHRAETH